jgi:hypothetical protein
MSTLQNELQLYWWLFMWPSEIENPLIWWANHGVQFPHVSFLAHQVIGNVGL